MADVFKAIFDKKDKYFMPVSRIDSEGNVHFNN